MSVMSDKIVFDDKYKIVILMDFYGDLLTDKTGDIMRLSLDEDMSLTEIAVIKGISRQAVHDSIKRGEENLLRYESELKMVQRTLDTRRIVNQMKALVNENATVERSETGTLKQLIDELDSLF